jgi:hypothetical protein
MSVQLRRIGARTDVALHAGADSALFSQLQKDHGVVLPADHVEMLRSSNGVEVDAGYFRLFGIYTTDAVDAATWNDRELWKFSWKGRCSGYWCFAETGWGDQYAYTLPSLRGGEQVRVYLLDALSMTPEIVASSFSEFVDRELIRSAEAPYDATTVEARRRLGPLGRDLHVVHVPSPLLTGAEDIESIQKMNARSAMICNGDIAVQLEEGPPDRRVRSVQSYEDDVGRLRIKLLWE